MLLCLRRICRVLALGLLIVAKHHCAALEPSTPLARLARQSWTVENGLPQNTIPLLMQSRNGYMWIGTELGLAKFDGYSFQILDHARFNSFPDAEIGCLLDDRRSDNAGTVWIGTADGLVLWTESGMRLFTTVDGLPSNSIRGLVQTSDGELWASTASGLAHLAGQRFVREDDAALAVGAVTSLAAAGDGSLWVAGSKGAAVLRNAAWKMRPQMDGSSNAANNISSNGPALVVSLPDGDVLVVTSEGLYQEHGARETRILTKAALPTGEIRFAARLRDGTLAVASQTSLTLAFGNIPDEQRVASARPVAPQTDPVVASFSVGKDLPGSRIQSLYADAEGSLWIGTNHGLVRAQRSTNFVLIERLPATDSLALDAVATIFEDREGDLWVGTETAGLYIFRDSRFHVIGTSDGLSSESTTAIIQAKDDSVWIGTRESGLNHLSVASKRPISDQAQSVQVFTTANGLLSNVILSLAASLDGSIWVGTPDGLNHIGSNGKVESFTSADGLPDDFIRSLLVDQDNTVWIGTRRGLTHMSKAGFETLTTSDGLGSDLVGALARSADGDLWAATLNGLTRLHQGSLRNFTMADGLSSNIITSLDPVAGGKMWIGTQDHGLNFWSGDRIVALPATVPVSHDTRPVAETPHQRQPRSLLPNVLHAVLDDDRGHLWLASDAGLTRADVATLLDCVGQNACRLPAAHIVNFGTADGLRSRDTSSNSHPTALRLRDGELWFTTPKGVDQVDPNHFAPLPAAPAALIERFTVDDQQVDQSTQNRELRLSPGHFRFQFDYSGLSFAAPQKLRYEYMLQDFDTSWTDAGARRTAYYTNIPPGKYHFLVRTAFGDNAFSDPAAGTGNRAEGQSNTSSYGISQTSLDFELQPHLYQTIWFRVLMLLAASAALLTLFRFRVSRVEREFRAVSAERNRIAREIHDTLAQGYVGISLQLEILGQLLRYNRADAAAQHLQTTQELVREGLADARQSIWALRSQDAHEQTLPTTLRRLVEKVNEPGLTSTFEIHGVYRGLAAETEKEVLRIAQEAIQNTRRHAAASQLRVRLDYDEQSLLLSVQDDGEGFQVSEENPSHVKKEREGTRQNRAVAGPGTRHFGLTGMRERAALIRAEIQILSEPGQGTTIQVKIPVPGVSLRDPSDSDSTFETTTNASRPNRTIGVDKRLKENE